eukprot:g7611.t1
MSQLLPETGAQQLNADVNIFTNLLVKDSGKYPHHRSYMTLLYVANAGPAVLGDGLTLNVVDLRGNCRTIHRPTSITAGELLNELEGYKRIFVGGREQLPETPLASIVNATTARVLVDGRPTRANVAAGNLIDMFAIETFLADRVAFNWNRPHYKGLVTTAGQRANYVYFHFQVIKKAIYGRVHLFIRAELGQDGRYHITDESSSGKVAVKQIYKSLVQRHMNSGREMFEDPLEEVAIMLSLGQVEPVHQNVMNVIEVGQDANSIYLVLPFADGGELFDTVNGGGAQEEGITRFYIRRMADGLMHLHQSGISMNDTSLENTMLHRFHEERIEPILMDFGMADFLLSDDFGARVKNKANLAGKISYLAPEVFRREKYDGVYADIWSLGVIAFMLMTGSPPFDQPNGLCARFSFVQKKNVSSLLVEWQKQKLIPRLSDYFHHLIDHILIPDKPWLRLPLPVILEHPFITGEILDASLWGKYQQMVPDKVFERVMSME